MIVRGRFVAGAAYVTVTLSSSSFTGGFARFLVDTGASRTILQDVDFRRLGIPRTLLTPAPSSVAGVGGTITCSVLPGVDVDFSTSTGGHHVTTQDIWVMPPLSAGLSLPSVLGRDILNLCDFKHDFPRGVVQLDF